MSEYGDRAAALFTEGYNCAQSVFLAFCDKMDLDRETALRLSSSFGGGVGRMREICGAVSGMAMVAGVLYGYSRPDDAEGKAAHYVRIRALADAFRAETGSIVCRELLGEVERPASATPEARTESYYHKRPCAELVRLAGDIMGRYLEENPPV